MNLRTGNFSGPGEAPRGDDFRAFLEWIHSLYRSWHIALLLDEDRSTGAARNCPLGETSVSLQDRQLNPLTRCVSQGKDAIKANKQYATIDEQVDRSATREPVSRSLHTRVSPQGRLRQTRQKVLWTCLDPSHGPPTLRLSRPTRTRRTGRGRGGGLGSDRYAGPPDLAPNITCR
jgi:hypothetical protein